MNNAVQVPIIADRPAHLAPISGKTQFPYIKTSFSVSPSLCVTLVTDSI